MPCKLNSHAQAVNRLSHHTSLRTAVQQIKHGSIDSTRMLAGGHLHHNFAVHSQMKGFPTTPCLWESWGCHIMLITQAASGTPKETPASPHTSELVTENETTYVPGTSSLTCVQPARPTAAR